MEIRAFGYLGVGTAKLDDWTALATKGLGMEAVDRGGSTRAFRMDDRKQRLVLDGAVPSGTNYFGWEVADARALESLAGRLEQAGVAVRTFVPPAPPMMEQEEEVAAEAPHYEEEIQHEEPVAVAPAPRAARIPPIEQFPRIAQEQVAAQQQRIVEIAEHSKKKRSIFDRLANVGLGRKHEALAEEAPARRAEPRIQRPAASAPVYQEPVPAPQPEASYDDDQLAIPAFLRRQVNG